MSIVVRTSVRAESIIPALTAAASSIDPDLPLFQLRTMRERMQSALAVERLLAWLLGTFAALALFLSAAGLYGIVSYLTTIRTKEYGIRLALGATSRHLRGIVVGQTLWLVMIGLVVGLALSAASARVLGALLFEVSPTDGLTYAGVGVVLALVGLAAAQWPARRAARVNPVTALRYE